MALIPDDQAKAARSIPVNDTAAKLGFIPKREGMSVKWMDDKDKPQYVINVTGEKFFDHIAGVGGAGSISLVEHVHNCSFREAVAWLIGFQHQIDTDRHHTSFFPKAQSTAPEPTYEESVAKYGKRDDSVWSVARDYLTKERHLPVALVDTLHAQGKIFSTNHQHVDKDGKLTFKRPTVAFPGTSIDGVHHSIFLRDTKHDSIFRMFIGKKTLAPFTLGDLKTAEKVVAVESPIDALSYHCLHDGKAFVTSMGGMTVSQSLIDLARTTGKPLVCALDNDAAGRHGWHSLQMKTLFHFSEVQNKPVVVESSPDGPMKLIFSLGCSGNTGITEDDARKLLHESNQKKIPTEIKLDGLPHNISREIPQKKDWNLDLPSLGQQALEHFKNRAAEISPASPQQQLER